MASNAEASTVRQKSEVKIACDELRQSLKECIKESECIQKQHRSARECVEAKDGTVPKECYELMHTLNACKRSMIDMRARFRGLKGTSETKNSPTLIK